MGWKSLSFDVAYLKGSGKFVLVVIWMVKLLTSIKVASKLKMLKKVKPRNTVARHILSAMTRIAFGSQVI